MRGTFVAWPAHDTARLTYDAIGLSGLALVVAVLANALFGALVSLGIGNYAPSSRNSP